MNIIWPAVWDRGSYTYTYKAVRYTAVEVGYTIQSTAAGLTWVREDAAQSIEGRAPNGGGDGAADPGRVPDVVD